MTSQDRATYLHDLDRKCRALNMPDDEREQMLHRLDPFASAELATTWLNIADQVLSSCNDRG